MYQTLSTIHVSHMSTCNRPPTSRKKQNSQKHTAGQAPFTHSPPSGCTLDPHAPVIPISTIKTNRRFIRSKSVYMPPPLPNPRPTPLSSINTRHQTRPPSPPPCRFPILLVIPSPIPISTSLLLPSFSGHKDFLQIIHHIQTSPPLLLSLLPTTTTIRSRIASGRVVLPTSPISQFPHQHLRLTTPFLIDRGAQDGIGAGEEVCTPGRCRQGLWVLEVEGVEGCFEIC